MPRTLPDLNTGIRHAESKSMMIFTRSAISLILAAALLIALSSSPAPGQEAADNAVWIPVTGSPTLSDYFRQEAPASPRPDPAWVARTGAKKGVHGSLLDEELIAGPDAAVLKSGFFESWPSLLARFREPSAFVEPDRIAGIEKTKPYLIIPTGGLQGLSGSKFFKAGLEEYARSGGIVLCFAQQQGTDFSALPVPAGSVLEAKGWNEDAGPLFGASSIRNPHPALAGTTKNTPDVESSGYLASYPAESSVLLSRSDGFATLIVYPYGAGRIVVATLFPDFSSAYERLEPDEEILLRDLVLWAKSADRAVMAKKGDKLELAVPFRGPEQGEAAAIRIFVVGPDDERTEQPRPLAERIGNDRPASLVLPNTIPNNIRPGLYRFEYVLLDASGKALSGRVESSGGGFSVGQPPTAALTRKTESPGGAPLHLRMNARWERLKKTDRLIVDLSADGKPSGSGTTILVRALGREQRFTPSADKTTLSFDVPETALPGPISVNAYAPSGRSIARLAVTAPSPDGKGIVLDRDLYVPGDKVALKLSKMGKGELTLAGPGYVENQVVSGDFRTEFPLPAPLPAGTYNLHWDLESLGHAARSGDAPINVAGYRVQIRRAELARAGNGDSTCRFGVRSDLAVSTQLKLRLRRPDGVFVPAGEKRVALAPGDQEVTISFPFKPDRSGIWELQYSFLTRLPAGPGFPAEPVALASGRILLDAGNAALLGIAPSRPVSYEPAGPIDLSVYVFGSGKAAIEVYRDDKRIDKEKLTLTGLSVPVFSIPDPGPGLHRLKAVITADALAGSLERPFIYGAQLPDLTISLRTGEITGLVAPVSVIVRNRGRSPSGAVRVALYEGDPSRKGRLIGRADVPQLPADAEHVAAIDWNLTGKAGERTLSAVVDAVSGKTALQEKNINASLKLNVPPVVLALKQRKEPVSADEGIVYRVAAANLADKPYQNLSLRIDVIGPRGNTLSSETVAFPDIDPGSEKQIDRTFLAPRLPAGGYRLQARLSQGANNPLVAASSAATIVPTLAVAGTLDRTPQKAAQCLPFTIEYGLQSVGNIPVSAGQVKLAVRSASSGMSAYTGQFPFSTDTKPVRFERMDFPQGNYVVTLKASVTNSEYGVTREFLLAEQALNVKAPAEMSRGRSPLPRVLIWIGKSSTTLEQAIAQNIVKQAFSDDVFYRTVDSAADFKNQAMGGLYNIFLLFDIDEPLEQTAWLQDRVTHGSTLVIIGPGERSRGQPRISGSGSALRSPERASSSPFRKIRE